MPLSPVSMASCSRPTPQTRRHSTAATGAAGISLRPAAAQAVAPPPQRPAAPAPSRFDIAAFVKAITALVAALWAACAALWRGKPEHPPAAPTSPSLHQALSEKGAALAPPQAQGVLRGAASQAAQAAHQAEALGPSARLAMQQPQRRGSCPPALHHPPSPTQTPLSTPASESAPLTPRDPMEASYVLVQAPDGSLAPEPTGWLSYFTGARAPVVAPTAKAEVLALVGPEHVVELLRRQLLVADTHEPAGAQNNDPNQLLASSPPASLLAADGSWIGLAKQFPTDAHRQSVVVTSLDKQGAKHTVPLGTFTSRRSTHSHSAESTDGMADHLLRICEGDVRWRFQLTQLLNQTVPNAVVHSLMTSEALTLNGNKGILMGTSHASFFEVVRRSHKRLHINHTSVWRGAPGPHDAEAYQDLPFYIDAQGMPHRFTGEARQVVQISLARPRKPNAAPRLGRISIDVTGSWTTVE